MPLLFLQEKLSSSTENKTLIKHRNTDLRFLPKAAATRAEQTSNLASMSTASKQNSLDWMLSLLGGLFIAGGCVISKIKRFVLKKL